jgi:hypothetical protein
MPEWLKGAVTNEAVPSLYAVAECLGISFVLGVIVAVVYIVTQRKSRAESGTLTTTLVLLTILIAMVTLVIGNSVARAFSLVGALAIVRFRTIVEDTRDTAFVMFAVIVGMAAGAGREYVSVALVGIPIVAVAAFLANLWAQSAPGVLGAPEHGLTIRLGIGREPGPLLEPIFEKFLSHVRLRVAETGRQGAVLDLSYVVRFRPGAGAIALVAELNRVEGVQGVEVRAL